MGAIEPRLGEASLDLLPPTTSSSSLWVLANQFDAEGTTHWQKMVALFQKNPQGFVNNNLNRLKRGVQLAIPSADEVQAVTRLEAQRVYADSLNRFNNSKGEKNRALNGNAESRRLQAELESSRNNILRSSEKNTSLSHQLKALENKAQSQIDALDLKNRQIEAIQFRLENLEARLSEKAEI